jgi:hypothetical protein
MVTTKKIWPPSGLKHCVLQRQPEISEEHIIPSSGSKSKPSKKLTQAALLSDLEMEVMYSLETGGSA